MKPGLTIIVLGGFFLSGGAIVQAEDGIQAPDRRQRGPGRAGRLGRFGRIHVRDHGNHVEHGDLEPGASGAGDATRKLRRRHEETCRPRRRRSRRRHAPRVWLAPRPSAERFQSSERSDANRQSRWPRDCPGGAAQTQSVRSVLNVRQTFRHQARPRSRPAERVVGRTAARSGSWTRVSCPALAALPVCDDMSSEVESVDPGCGEPRAAAEDHAPGAVDRRLRPARRWAAPSRFPLRRTPLD